MASARFTTFVLYPVGDGILWTSVAARPIFTNHPREREPLSTSPGAGKRYIQAGMSDGLQTAGLQHDRIEFAEGLKVAFEMADAGVRWLRGQRLFAAAVL